MKAATNDSVLIEQVVYLASKARVATGQEPIADIQKGTTSARSCPIALALNLGCEVSAGRIEFQTREHARRVAEACGLSLSQGHRIVSLPVNHPFSVFVSRFDAKASTQMRQLRRSPW